jgi:hypothetical protein
MRVAAVAIAASLAGASPASAEPSFDSEVASARPLRDLEGLIWAVSAACDRGDDVERRQCRLVRDARQRELASQTLLIDGEPGAVEVGAWDGGKRSLALSIAGCVRCNGVDVGDRTYFLLATNPAGSKSAAGIAAQGARTFMDEAAARVWAATLGHARVQWLVKLPSKPRWADPTHQAIELDLVGVRAYMACDGVMIAASPPATDMAPDRSACARDNTPVADELTSDQVKEAMKPFVSAAHACFDKHQISGLASWKIAVAADGVVTKADQKGDFVGTPMAACLDKAIASVHLPRANKPFTFAFPLRLP